MKNKNEFFKIFILICFSLLLSSCGGSGTFDSENSSTDSSTESDNNSGSNSTPLTLPSGYSSSDFFVTMATSFPDITTTTVSGSALGDRCAFTSTESGEKTCIVEANELGLFFNGLQLHFNVPANTCKYVSKTPYWYYNQEVGYGPSQVFLEVTKDSSGTVTSYRCSKTNLAGLSSPNCTSIPELVFDNVGDDVKVRCIYDTSSFNDGQNCCMGSYDLTKINVDSGGGSQTKISKNQKWGDSTITQCLGGAGRTDWKLTNKQGYPVSEIVDARSGLSELFNVRAPLLTIFGQASNLPIANFFKSEMHSHTGYGALNTSTSNYPYFLDPLSDRVGNAISSGRPYYSFDCLDESFEVQKRIKILVREWNTTLALESYISTGSISTSPDVSGTATTNCDDLTDEVCNDLTDADDLVENLGGTYDQSTPSNRDTFFPNHQYSQ